MLELYREQGPAGQPWTFCRWHESPDGGLALVSLPFLDAVTAAHWLRGFRADGLRRLAFEVLDPQALHRSTESQLVQQLAAMMVLGDLRVFQGGLNLRSPQAHNQEPSTEDKLVRRLRVTSHTFHFEGDRYRIVSARDWAVLRGSDDERFQVVPQHQAQPLMKRLAASFTVSADEAAAIAEAVPLLPDVWRPTLATSGMLLIRIVESVLNLQSAGSAESATPSQLSGRQKDEDHWIQITLVDDQDKPVPNQAYKIELPGGEIREGRLDDKGLAYVGGLKVGGQCKVCFPLIDSTEWHAA